MPLYEFECIDCGHKFEAIATPDTGTYPCPRCSDPKEAPALAQRLISAPAFKVNGFNAGNRYSRRGY